MGNRVLTIIQVIQANRKKVYDIYFCLFTVLRSVFSAFNLSTLLPPLKYFLGFSLRRYHHGTASFHHRVIHSDRWETFVDMIWKLRVTDDDNVLYIGLL